MLHCKLDNCTKRENGIKINLLKIETYDTIINKLQYINNYIDILLQIY